MKSKATRKRLPPNGKEPVLGQCALTGETLPHDRLVRLVASPDGKLVVDLGSELPGPELWLALKESVIERAEQENLPDTYFGKALKRREPLTHTIDQQLRKKALSFFGLAKKEGILLSGYSKVSEALKQDKALLLLLVKGERDYGKEDIRKLAPGIFVEDAFSLTELQSALSNGNSMHVVLKGGALSTRCLEAVRKLRTYHERTELNDE